MRIYGVNIEHESIMNASAYVNKPGKDDNGIQLTLTACPSTSSSVSTGPCAQNSSLQSSFVATLQNQNQTFTRMLFHIIILRPFTDSLTRHLAFYSFKEGACMHRRADRFFKMSKFLILYVRQFHGYGWIRVLVPHIPHAETTIEPSIVEFW